MSRGRVSAQLALDVYEPLQLENQRVSSLAGALVDELAEEFVLGSGTRAKNSSARRRRRSAAR